MNTTDVLLANYKLQGSADPPVSARLGKAPVYLSNCCIPDSQVATQRNLLRPAVRLGLAPVVLFSQCGNTM